MLITCSFTKAIAIIYLIKNYALCQGDIIDFFARSFSETEPKSSASASGAIALSEDLDKKNWLSLGDLSLSRGAKSFEVITENNSSPLEEQSKPTETVDFLVHFNNEQLRPSDLSGTEIYEKLNHSYGTNHKPLQSIKYQNLDNESKYDDQRQIISSSYSQAKFYSSLLPSNKCNVNNHEKSSPQKAINHRFELLGSDADYFGKGQNAKYHQVQDKYEINNAKKNHASPNSETYASKQRENLSNTYQASLTPVQKSKKKKSLSEIISLLKKTQSEDSKKESEKLFGSWNNLNKYNTKYREKLQKDTLEADFESQTANIILQHTEIIKLGDSPTKEKSLEQNASSPAGKSSGRGTKRKMFMDIPQEKKLIQQNPNLKLLEAKDQKICLENETVPQEQIEYAFTNLISQKNQLCLSGLLKEYKTNAKFIEEKKLKNLVLTAVKHIESQIKSCSGDSFYIKNKEVTKFLSFNTMINFKSLAPNHNPIWSKYEFKNYHSDLKLKLGSIKLSRIVTDLLKKQKNLYQVLANQKQSSQASLKLDLITNSFMGKLFLFYSIIINRVFCNDLNESEFIIREVVALEFYSWTFENFCEKETGFSPAQIKLLKDRWPEAAIQVSDTNLVRIIKKIDDIKTMFKCNVSKRDHSMIWLLVELWLSCFRVDLYSTIKNKQNHFKNFGKFVGFIVYLTLNFSPKVFLPKYKI
ncbi:hypothetical protein BY996DRAFT_7414630 [Phakopsora pachyrhizi]|nr:hypothetical protein BY996DRAFT_7414630 [Phakopsora pachyrhizi]